MEDEYFNFQFEDWYGSDFPTKGLIRSKIIQMLFEIHSKWNEELKRLDVPYYLAIWFHEPNILRSEVVCAIGQRINRYEKNVFTISKKSQNLKSESFGALKHYFDQFNWTRNIQYEVHYNSDYNWPKESYDKIQNFYKNQRFYKKVLPKCSRIEEDQYGKVYFQEIGDIWVGIIK